MVLLVPKNKSWDVFLSGLNGFSDDFMDVRPNETPQKRNGL
jgi:virulence-associated protein VagC